MIPRLMQPKVAQLLEQFPAVALLGPRQVGKTTLATSLADSLGENALYLDLELPSDRAKLSDPELYLNQHEDRLVILDEIHRLPGLFETLRSLIDRRRRKGNRSRHFLLLGSASIDLLHQSAETLAGRIAYEELTPLSVAEVAGYAPNATDRLWVRGGFPDSFLATSEENSLRWRVAFIQTYLERDVPALGPRIPAETLRRYWQMLAHNQGQMLNAAQLASGLGVSGHTVARYLDIMVDLLLVRRLQPWATNAKKRLVRTPKVYGVRRNQHDHHGDAHDEERYNLLNAFFATVPGNTAFNLRRLYLLNTNFADLSLLFTVDTGSATNRQLNSEYLAVLETGQATPYYLNLHQQDVAHTLILGATGSGKSFLLNFLIQSLQKYDPQTYIFDLGGSFENITRIFGGSYLNVGPAGQPFTINPFSLPPDKVNLDFLYAFLKVLIEGTGKHELSGTEERSLYSAVERIYRLDPRTRTLTSFAAMVGPLAEQLQRWTRAGQFGHVFDNAQAMRRHTS
jgi:energy-coupling factor transporter ATP-binding protein EcfA2